jgi:Domain of Unknown Function (DUF748)
VHTVDALQLSLPFISNLPAEVEVKVEPRLAFKLNGAAFDSGAQATPFAQTKAGDLKLSVNSLDLTPYLPYLPASLPVRVTRGSVSADVSLTFSVPEKSAPNVSLKGSTHPARRSPAGGNCNWACAMCSRWHARWRCRACRSTASSFMRRVTRRGISTC